MRVVALIVAAGRGTRAGHGLPKQYRPVGGIPLVRHCLNEFSTHARVDQVMTIIHEQDVSLYEEMSAGCEGLLPAVFGGETRQASVLAGLEALSKNPPTHVLIHDGARPFAGHALIDRVLDALQNHDAALPGLPVSDTLRHSKGKIAGETIDRTDIVRAQTPQGFAFNAILNAHREAGTDQFTDDIAVAAAAGIKATLIAGAEENFKVTEPHDFTRAERFLAVGTEVRTGSGFDVHRFCAGEKVTLCGVDIPHTHSLLGHSDADVALHAVTDALLGAIGEGDIGLHFPPSDLQWKGAPSSVFLKHAVTLLKAKQGRLNNIDLTIICEAPKITPHRDRLRGSLASILGVSPDRVSVKATTTEGLGFTGRSEGIAAQATATVSLPLGADRT